MSKFKNALVSVSDKTGLVEFLRPLVADGLRVVSTGGTLKHLRENGIAAVDIAEQTGFPEVMGGRVKTLHPRVHMALLSRDSHPEDQEILEREGLKPFDLLVVNLYPFEEARLRGVEGPELIEFIDIGGPSMLRSAAKNFQRITVLTHPEDYQHVLERLKNGGRLPNVEERQMLAAKVFSLTSRYDDLISRTLAADSGSFSAGSWNNLNGRLVSELRYGENPTQKASWYRDVMAKSGLHDAEILHGKALSYNNLLDLDAACSAVSEFRSPATVAVKHNNPCGVATVSDTTEIATAVGRALGADPVSVFGGIVAVNREVDLDAAEALASIFLECVIAPSFNENALERLKKKKDLRILRWKDLAHHQPTRQFRTIAGGYLVQSSDRSSDWSDSWKVVGKKAGPTGLVTDLPISVKADLLLAWKVAAHLRSNAIAIAASGQTVGLGMGQVNRVDAVEQAISRMQKHHGSCTKPVLASDAFFPFADSMERIAEAGVEYVIQPGGSIRDQEVLTKAQALGITTVLTSIRHFRH